MSYQKIQKKTNNIFLLFPTAFAIPYCICFSQLLLFLQFPIAVAIPYCFSYATLVLLFPIPYCFLLFPTFALSDFAISSSFSFSLRAKLTINWLVLPTQVEKSILAYINKSTINNKFHKKLLFFLLFFKSLLLGKDSLLASASRVSARKPFWAT